MQEPHSRVSRKRERDDGSAREANLHDAPRNPQISWRSPSARALDDAGARCVVLSTGRDDQPGDCLGGKTPNASATLCVPNANSGPACTRDDSLAVSHRCHNGSAAFRLGIRVHDARQSSFGNGVHVNSSVRSTGREDPVGNEGNADKGKTGVRDLQGPGRGRSRRLPQKDLIRCSCGYQLLSWRECDRADVAAAHPVSIANFARTTPSHLWGSD